EPSFVTAGPLYLPARPPPTIGNARRHTRLVRTVFAGMKEPPELDFGLEGFQLASQTKKLIELGRRVRVLFALVWLRLEIKLLVRLQIEFRIGPQIQLGVGPRPSSALIFGPFGVVLKHAGCPVG